MENTPKPKKAKRCNVREMRTSGRGGFPSLWYVFCKKPRAKGHIYCEKHTAEFYARLRTAEAARKARKEN